MKIVGFGDFLIHFSPLGNERFMQSKIMEVSYTGAEANVCAALSLWGENVEFITKIPDNALAKKGIMFLNGLGIKTDYLKTGNGRMGIYFLEKGYSVRPSSVIYDRENTLFTKCKYEEFDWENIFKNTEYFYLSGITPSLSQSLLTCCEKILFEAQKRNIPVFYDVNLRPAICDIEKSREIFSKLSPYISYLIGNEEHLKQLLEIQAQPTEKTERLFELTKKIQEITKINNIAITVRRTLSANKSAIYASLYTKNSFAISQKQEIDVIDRVGSGDAFSAGIVYSVIHDLNVKTAVEFSTVSSALKHTITNDINFSTVSEIENIIENRCCDVKR